MLTESTSPVSAVASSIAEGCRVIHGFTKLAVECGSTWLKVHHIQTCLVYLRIELSTGRWGVQLDDTE